MSNRSAAPGGVILYAGASPLGTDRALRRSATEALRRFHQVAESAPTTTLERTSITEASVGGAKATGPSRMLVRLIKAGVSLNLNAYPKTALTEAARNRMFAKGTACYVDHASPEEEDAHPSGSIKNLAGVLAEDARWDEASQSLVAEVRLFSPWRDALTDMAEHIGMSIRAWVTGERGTYEGQDDVFVVSRIEGGRSVDFVTVPAAGGGIISVLEAVGNKVPVQEARNAGHWFESRIHQSFTNIADEMFGEGYLTREERIALSSAVGDGLAAFAARVEADCQHLYQRDPYAGPPEPEPASQDEPEAVVADETTESAPESAEPEQDVTDGAPPSAPETPPTEQEPEMSGTQTGAPPEQAGTATVPDTEPTPTTAPATEAVQPTGEAFAAAVTAALAEALAPMRQQMADMAARESMRDAADRDARNRQTATEAVTNALAAAEHADVASSIRTRVIARVTSAVPTTAEGAVDPAALGEFVATVIADEATHVRRERDNALAEAGVGLPYGMGGTPVAEAEDDGLEGEMKKLFGDLGLSTEAADIAAKGRVR